MVDINSSILIIILYANGLNAPTRDRFVTGDQKIRPKYVISRYLL